MADGFKSQPAGIDAVVAQFVSIQKQLDDARRSLAGLGLHIDGPTGNLIIDANAMLTANFNGTLSPPAAGTTGVAIVNDTIIVNNIVLAGQIIGNDALTSPVKTDAKNDLNSGYTWTTSFVAQASVTFTVPTGFTTANVLAVGHNGTQVAGAPSGAIYLYTAVDIAGSGSASSEATLATSGGGVTVPAAWARQITGLTGGNTIAVTTYGQYTSASGGSVPATGTGNSRVSAIITYTR